MSDTMPPNDTAPWWIKEIRIYGISAIVALGASWFMWKVYEDSRLDAKEQNARIELLTMRSQDLTTKNTEGYYVLSKSLWDLTAALKKEDERQPSSHTP